MSSTSQSVGRTIALFEAFARERRALTAVEIATLIDAPRSSCAALLKTLADLDMISLDRRTSSYFPTARFAEMGSWITDGSLYPPALLNLLKMLKSVTGETVTLAAYQDLSMELVQVERSDQAISFTAEKGQIFPIWGTGVGTAYLSTLDAPQIRALYRRAEDRKLIDSKAMPIETVLAQVDHARREGYHVAEAAVFPDATAVSAAAGIQVAMRELVISITGPTTRVRGKYELYGRMLNSEAARLRAELNAPP